MYILYVACVETITDVVFDNWFCTKYILEVVIITLFVHFAAIIIVCHYIILHCSLVVLKLPCIL